jgi:tetratricopeptide (TPR) repeat protein
LLCRAAASNFQSIAHEAVEINELAVHRAKSLDAQGWLSMAEYGLGQAYLAAGRYRDAEQTLGRAYARLADPDIRIPTGTTKSRLSVLCNMMKSVAHVAMGELEQAEISQRRASVIAAETKRPHDVIAAGYGRGGFELVWGSLSNAASTLEEALALARQHGVKQFIPVIACHLGNLYLQQNRAVEARDILLAAKSEAEALGHILSILRASIYLGMTLYRIDGASSARQMVSSAREQAARQGFQGITVEALVAEATICASAASPDIAESRQCLEAAIPIASRIEARSQLAAARALMGSILAREGNISDGLRDLWDALDLFAAMKMARQYEATHLLLSDVLRNKAAALAC